MNISPLKLFGINNISKSDNNLSFFGLRLSNQINKDTVSFTGKMKDSFQTRKDAIEYYKNIGQSVNKSLEEDDDITAFETLGYNVDSDFETDKITINGDFKPYFTVFVKGQKTAEISYEDIGIDQEELLRNVEKITGEKHLSPSFIPDQNFVINNSKIYPEKLSKRLQKIIDERASAAKKALDEGNDEQALKALGFDAETDENGNIKINGDYSAKLLTLENKMLTLQDYNIDENRLLKNVTQINGKASFLKDFAPDHYIETKSVECINFYSGTRQIKEAFVKAHPDYKKQMSEIKSAAENKDTAKMLQLMGFDASVDKDGTIAIDGDFMFYFPIIVNGEYAILNFKDLGIDEAEIFNQIGRISKNAYMPDIATKKLKGGMEIGGYVSLGKRTKEEEFFAEYISPKNIAELYEGIPEDVIRKYAEEGIFKPSVKTHDNVYFNFFNEENRAFLDRIMQQRDKILTSKDLQEKYGVSAISVDHVVQNGLLKGYLLEDINTKFKTRSNDFLFDITDERNKEGLLRLAKTGKTRQLAKLRASSVSNSEFEQACIRNSVKSNRQNSEITSFPAEDLEKLGYGSKADLISNCGLRVNTYEIRQYILNNDSYDISKPFMMDTILKARHNNPSIVSLSTLQKKLGNNRDKFREAVTQDKLNIITENPYRITYPEDYCIDLSDEKNLAFLTSIYDVDFQYWLQGVIKAKKEYSANNEQTMQEFMRTKAPTNVERRKLIEAELKQIETERKKAQEAKKLEAQEKKLEQNRRRSLRSTIAWVLCPQTKQIKREHSNEKVQEIIGKSKEVKEINEQLLAGEITFEEAKERIKKLSLSKNDEIALLSYHKTCWDISGTEEWKQALSDAKEIMETYEKEGLDGIDNPEIKQRLIKWENDWARS